MKVLNKNNIKNITLLLSYVLQKDFLEDYKFTEKSHIFLTEYYSKQKLDKKEKELFSKIYKKLTNLPLYSKEKIILTIDESDLIRDLCSDILVLVGFDENYNVTKEGEILEDLIDVLYIE